MLKNGDFKAEITLSGGSGRAKIESPADVHVEDGKITATLVWSSSSYDYMEVGGVGYTPEIVDGKAVFTVEIPALDEELAIKAETVAMSAPHMIDYTLLVSGAEIRATENSESSTVSESSTSTESSANSTSSESSTFTESSTTVESSSSSTTIESSTSAESSTISTGEYISSESISVPESGSHAAPLPILIVCGAVLAAVIALVVVIVSRKAKK